jgi:hypothetical protein
LIERLKIYPGEQYQPKNHRTLTAQSDSLDRVLRELSNPRALEGRLIVSVGTLSDVDRKSLESKIQELLTDRLNRVINWSLSDKNIRIRIPVGTAYGSDTKLAPELLVQTARKNPLVLSEPAPEAVFKGFGDNSLDFELRVYINGIIQPFAIPHSSFAMPFQHSHNILTEFISLPVFHFSYRFQF